MSAAPIAGSGLPTPDGPLPSLAELQGALSREAERESRWARIVAARKLAAGILRRAADMAVTLGERELERYGLSDDVAQLGVLVARQAIDLAVGEVQGRPPPGGISEPRD